MPTKAKTKGASKGAKVRETPARPAKRARAAKAEAEPAAAPAAHDSDEEDDVLDEDVDEAPAPPKREPPAKAATGASRESAAAPVRRLTPAARQQINALVAKGMSLDQALKAAASWETVEPPAAPASVAPGPSSFRPRSSKDEDGDSERGDGLDAEPPEFAGPEGDEE